MVVVPYRVAPVKVHWWEVEASMRKVKQVRWANPAQEVTGFALMAVELM